MATAAEPLLLGRDAVCERLSERLARAARGAGGLVWISGEAGIGKTTLLSEACRLAEARGFRVLHGAAWDDPGTPPLWLWAQVLRDAGDGVEPAALMQTWGPRSQEALALLPGVRVDRATDASAPGTNRFALFDSVTGVLETLSRDRPLLLVLDDLHWTDAGSLRLLRFVERSLGRWPVLVAAAWRDHESLLDDTVAGLADELASRADRVPLQGLDAEAVGQLVAAETGGVLSDAAARLLHERTGGNPLFVGELARLAVDRGTDVIDSAVPESATAIIRRRLGRVSQACHELLVAGAVAGTASSVETVARLTDQSAAAVAGLLDEAIAAGLARDVPGRVELPHPLIRAAVVASVPASRVRELHLAAATLIAQRVEVDPSAAAEVAQHLHRAIPLSDAAAAVAMSRRAAVAALAVHAYEEAAEHLTAALEVSEPGSEVRRQVLLERGAARLTFDNLESARADFLQAAALARVRSDADGMAEAALGFAAGLSGFEVRLWDRTQIDLLEEALTLLGDQETVARADVMARLSVAMSFADDPERRSAMAEDAVVLARKLDDPRAIAHALAARCDTMAGPSHSERRAADAGEVIACARRVGDRGLELLGLRLRILALLEQGNVAAARVDMTAFEAAAAALRQPLYSWYVPLFRGFIAHLDGDIALQRRCANEAEELGRRAGSHNAVILSAVQRSWTAIEEMQTDAIFAELSRLVEDLAETAPDGIQMMALFPGQSREARAAALPGIEAAVAGLSDDAEQLSNLCLVAIAAWDAHDPPTAAAVLHRALAPWAGRFGVDGIAAGAIGPVDRFLGMLAILMGDLAAAEEHLVRARDLSAASGAVLCGIHTLRHQAEVCLLRAAPGDMDRGRQLLAETEASYRALGLDARADEAARRCAGQAPATAAAPPADAEAGSFQRDGDVWRVSYGGVSAVVRHVKGMTDLAVLLGRPGVEVHVLDLAGAPGAGMVEGDTGPALDEQARAAYKQRLDALDDELDDAVVVGDEERRRRAEEERSFLMAELSAAFGLGGRARRTGATAERARSAVTWRIRDAIRRLEAAEPGIGTHLRHAVQTGTFCRYEPERPVTWLL
ncbi:AAA family ATPase [Nocardioides sp. WS12]|uniref:ATP-binding protein n=1 Tax=Nocardioides sp. WS12 TaxID=2486272 RepID=UPI0015F7CF9F|nr:AAA family ATPase [Nocardioides sp. WS12]